MPITVSGGYYYTRTDRTSSRYQFQYFSPDGALPVAVAQERPDFLLSDFNIYTFNIQLRDTSGEAGAAAYDADLIVHAGYAQVEAEFTDTLRATVGVRYEDGEQNVQPVGAVLAPTNIANTYWLPAATLTWQFMPDMQLRLHASKTIARPQFRELAQQIYQDFESDREFSGNPFLQDSELFNCGGALRMVFRARPAALGRRLLQEDRQSDRGGRLLRERPEPAPRRLRQRAGGRALRRRVRGAGPFALVRPGRHLLRQPPPALRRQLHLHQVADHRRRFA